jgi:hypothetical protein
VATIEASNTVIRRADDRQTDNCLHASILPVHFTIKPRFNQKPADRIYLVRQSSLTVRLLYPELVHPDKRAAMKGKSMLNSAGADTSQSALWKFPTRFN